VLGASLYIIACSARNRMVRRLRRLREPRYLIGAVVGAAYMYFAVFARISRARGGGSRGRTPTPASAAGGLLILQAAGPALAGAGLLVIAALAWIFPGDSGLLDFSEAETAFLFPAPVTRRQLLIHRLMRSQFPLLFGAAMSAAFVPLTSIAARVRFAAGLFVMFVGIRVYFTGVTLARGRLMSAGASARRLAWAPLAIVLAAGATVGNAIVRAFAAARPATFTGLMANLGPAVSAGPASVILWPFVTLVRPLFAQSSAEFLGRLLGAVAVLAVAVAWVLRSDEVFQGEAAAHATVRKAETKARRGAPAPRVRAAGWLLPLSGRTEALFLWKNGMQTLRGANIRALLIVALIVVAAVARVSATGSGGPAEALCMVALFVAAFSIVLGPQTARSDLRGDLRHIELLKTWPVKAAAVVRGEMLWPAILLTVCAWFALLCATFLSAAAFPQLTLAWRLSLCVAAILMTPALVFAQLTAHNAAAVLFPAWIPTGNQRPRGLDAMGQRLILFAAVLLSLIVMVGPGAIAGGIVWFAFFRLIGAAVLVPAAALCLGIVAVEVLLATEALGPAYEQIDLSDVERAE
jgi:ABC-2 type transport system permease protein